MDYSTRKTEKSDETFFRARLIFKMDSLPVGSTNSIVKVLTDDHEKCWHEKIRNPNYEKFMDFIT